MSETSHAIRVTVGSARLRFFNLMSKAGVYVMIVVLLIVGTIVAPGIFLTLNNMIDVVEVGAMLGIVALGVTFVTYSGQFLDMSIPSIMAFSGIIAVQLLPFGLFVSILGALLTGCLAMMPEKAMILAAWLGRSTASWSASSRPTRLSGLWPCSS